MKWIVLTERSSHTSVSVGSAGRRLDPPMPQCIEDFVRSKYGMKEYSTPADEHLFNEDPSAQNLDPSETKAFYSMVMKLMYMCRCMRGDALLPVLYLSRNVKSPTVSDDDKLKRVAGYLKRTQDGYKVISTNKIERVEMISTLPSLPTMMELSTLRYAMVTFVGTTATC